MKEILNIPEIEKRIHTIRDKQVILDKDIAELYGVETKQLNEQVKRNKERFPEEFMIRLAKSEFDNLKSQNATSSWGGRRTLPYAFTEQGVTMLSSVSLFAKRRKNVSALILTVICNMKVNHSQLERSSVFPFP